MTVTRDGVEVRLSSTDLEDLHTVLAALESLRETGGDAGAPPADRNRGGGGPRALGEGAGEGAL
jgi:hypothetical protein